MADMDESFRPPSRSSATRPVRKPACVACTNRKVKCDRTEPCLSCRRTKLVCNYPDIADPARRKRKKDGTTQALLETIRGYEDKLREAGLPFKKSSLGRDVDGNTADEWDGQPVSAMVADEHGISRMDRHGSKPLLSYPMSAPPAAGIQSNARSQPLTRGLLVPEYGGRRYYEHGLLGALAKEYKQDLIEVSGEDDLPSSPSFNRQPYSEASAAGIIMGGSTASPGSSNYRPYEVTFKHWLVFSENVQPLSMVLHMPSVQKLFIGRQELLETPASTAIRYAIGACAVASLPTDACESIFGDEKKASLRFFQSSANQALQASSFMRVPTLELLQAYLLYLTSMIHTTDPSTIWVLFGSALRLAQTQGLHRDGTSFGLSPFETEMRRRLWWYVVSFDARLSELTGSESTLPASADTPMPANLNDNDMSPEMTRLEQRTGATDMTFCLVKYEICHYIKQHHIALCRCNTHGEFDHHHGRGQDEYKSVIDLESLLQERFLRYCDPVVPLQFLATLFARASLCKLTQMARPNRVRGPNDPASGLMTPVSSSPDSLSSTLQHDSTLKIATRNVEYDNLVHGTRALTAFLWHVHFYFPWGAPVFVLKELAARPIWDTSMEIAWVRVQEMFANHPEFFEDEKVLHLVLGNLALKVWDSHFNQDGNEEPTEMIARLQATQISFWSKHAEAQKDAMSLFIPEGIWDANLQYQQFFSGQFDYNAEPIMPSG